MGGLRERWWEMDAGFLGLGYKTILQQPFFLRRAGPSQGKNDYPTLWVTTRPTGSLLTPFSGILLASPSGILFTPPRIPVFFSFFIF